MGNWHRVYACSPTLIRFTDTVKKLYLSDVHLDGGVLTYTLTVVKNNNRK